MFRTRAGSLQKGQFQFFPSFLWPLNLKAIHHFIVSFNFNTWPDTCCDLSQACNAIEEGYNPGITFIVAQKRHNTRFFPSNPQSRDILPKNGNVLPGYYSLLWQWYCFTFYAFEVYTWDQKSAFVTGLGWVNLLTWLNVLRVCRNNCWQGRLSSPQLRFLPYQPCGPHCIFLQAMFPCGLFMLLYQERDNAYSWAWCNCNFFV